MIEKNVRCDRIESDRASGGMADLPRIHFVAVGWMEALNGRKSAPGRHDAQFFERVPL